jgi:regulator of CtrA degradation
MNNQFEEQPNMVSFGQKLASSEAFRALFKEGMSLVEETAAYLDGPGRAASKALSRADSLSYSSESMRLTTRLMQLASWLLLQHAVNEGEMTLAQASKEKHKVRLARQDIATSRDAFDRLPAELRELTLQSLRLQERILHLDQLIYNGETETPAPAAADPSTLDHSIAGQFERLRAAFPGRSD